jgi:hypothetical protein
LKIYRPLRLAIALSLTMFVSGCLGSAVSVKPRVVIPALDPRVERACEDPGVSGTFGQALAENRTALVICTERHNEVVAAYNEAREQLGPQQ